MLRTIFWFFVTVVLVIREIVGWRSLGRSIRPAFTLSTVPATSSPAEETAAERRERLRIRARRMMFNEKGVPYAPWMVRRMDEEELIDLLIQQEDREQRRGKRKPVPRDGQIESNGDLNWKVVNGNVQLTWSTSAEDDTVGYVVEKRAAGVGQYQLVASYDDVSQLKSKGVQGGMYRFVDSATTKGSWMYRVLECSSKGECNPLCQNLVEVQSEAEQRAQALTAVGLVTILAGIAALAYGLDPPR